MRFGPFLGIAFLLLLIWIGAFVFFHIASFMIHILLILAVISFIAHFFTGAKTA